MADENGFEDGGAEEFAPFMETRRRAEGKRMSGEEGGEFGLDGCEERGEVAGLGGEVWEPREDPDVWRWWGSG